MKTILGIVRMKYSECGITMIEMMIALFMAGMITSAAFGVYVTQHNQLIAQDDIADLQGTARVVADRLSKDIRKAGFNLPASINPIESTNSWPDTLIIRYSKSGFYGVVTSQDMENSNSDIYCTGSYFQDLSPGEHVYIHDPISNQGELIIASEVNYDLGIIEHSRGSMSRAYPSGSQLFKVEKIKYFLDQTDTYNSKLMVEKLGGQPEIYAENIESISFSYHLSNGYVAPNFTNPHDVRMVEISVTSKSEQDMQNSDNTYAKSRNYTVLVKMRNMGLS